MTPPIQFHEWYIFPDQITIMRRSPTSVVIRFASDWYFVASTKGNTGADVQNCTDEELDNLVYCIMEASHGRVS